jgi:cell division protein FtsI (penicillin-binding protein 3)
MDTKTGEILALADEPGFDPNNFSRYGAAKTKNKVITDTFDPGSTFKPFLAAAALEEDVAKETTRFNCENGEYHIADRVIREANRKKHGTLSFHDVLKYSSNIGSVKIYERLGKDKFYDYITRFGFGQKTGIDLPGESPGLLRPKEKWTRVDGSTIAFGQGISVTAVQLIAALSAIANDGLLMKPYIVKGLVNKNGKVINVTRPTPVRQVVSAKTAKRMTAILTDVVGEEDGTGKKARIENCAVAGKTGTSQKFDFSRGVYSSEKVRTSFMGFFPADKPQIAMLITLDEPQRDRWGGVAAAPVFKSIGEQILTRFKTDIPENPVSPVQEDEIVQAPAVRFVSTRSVVGEAHAAPAPVETVGEPVMPDFRGMTIREVLRKSRELGIDVKAVGNGWAVSQNPAPGGSLRDNKLCVVSFKAAH